MASTGRRVRAVFAEIVGRKAKSIQDTDELSHYGFGRANFFSLLEKMEKGLNKYGLCLEISDSDNSAIMELKTIKDLVNLIGKISKEYHRR